MDHIEYVTHDPQHTTFHALSPLPPSLALLRAHHDKFNDRLYTQIILPTS